MSMDKTTELLNIHYLSEPVDEQQKPQPPCLVVEYRVTATDSAEPDVPLAGIKRSIFGPDDDVSDEDDRVQAVHGAVFINGAMDEELVN